MPQQVTRSHMVVYMQLIIASEQLIAERTGGSSHVVSARILRKEDRDIRLPRHRIADEQVDNIVQVAEAMVDADVLLFLVTIEVLPLTRPAWPITLHVVVVKPAFIVTELIRTVGVWPSRPLYAGIDRFATDTLGEVIIGPWQVRLNVSSEFLEASLERRRPEHADGKADVHQLKCRHLRLC